MSGWFYIKKGMFDDKEVGPIADSTLLELSFDGKVDMNTMVCHQQHTRGQWMLLEQIPLAKRKYAEGKEKRQADAEQRKREAQEQKQRKQEEAERKKAEREEEKRKAAIASATQVAPPSILPPLRTQPTSIISVQPVALSVPRDSSYQERVPCPFCGEAIVPTAVKCRHCNEFLDGRQTSQPQQVFMHAAASAPAVNVVVNQQTNVSYAHKRWSPIVAMLLSLLLPGMGQLYKGQLLNGLVWFIFVVVGYVIFIIPGVVLHLCCIAGAGLGDPYR